MEFHALGSQGRKRKDRKNGKEGGKRGGADPSPRPKDMKATLPVGKYIWQCMKLQYADSVQRSSKLNNNQAIRKSLVVTFSDSNIIVHLICNLVTLFRLH